MSDYYPGYLDYLAGQQQPQRNCPNCGQPARNDGSDYSDICTQWPRCKGQEASQR